MKIPKTLTKLIAMNLAVATLVATVLLRPVAAQMGDGSVKFVSYTSVGIVPGEKVRLSVANDETSAGTATLSLQYYLAHGTNSESVPLYESELIQVPPGGFQFADVARNDLKTEGDPVTGRAQVLVKLTLVAPAGSDPEDFPWALEVFDDEAQAGNAVQIDSKYRLIILAAKRSRQLAPIGLDPGQMLSFTFFNPNEEGSQPVRVQAYVYDQTGRLLTQTDPVELRPGGSYIRYIDRDQIPVDNEKGTGRLQVGIRVQAALMDGSVRHVEIPVWVELVDKRTGRTQAGNYNYFAGTVSVSGDGE